MTISRMAFSGRAHCPCSHEQMQAHRHVHADHVSHMLQAGSIAWARAAMAADVTGRAARGGGAGAAHLHNGDDHREEDGGGDGGGDCSGRGVGRVGRQREELDTRAQ